MRLSFLFSAACISRLRVARGSFRAERTALTEDKVVRPWHEYTEGLRYMRASPLILGIALVGIGWASGGGAAQILFSLFGELVFNRGPAGIGYLWAAAGVGLLVGGAFAHWLGKRISFDGYKRTISICYVIHGGAYVIFSQMRNFQMALLFLGISRAAVAVSSVLNMSQLLRHVSERISRPRVCDHGNDAVVHDDAFDGGRRSRVRKLEPAHHRRCVRPAQLQHRVLLAVGELDRPIARAGARRRGARKKLKCTATRWFKWIRNLLYWSPARPSASDASIALRLLSSGLSRRDPLRFVRERRRATAEECGSAPLFQANLERVDDIRRMFREVDEQLGGLYGLVNNAARFRRVDPLATHRSRLGLHPQRESEGHVLLLPAGALLMKKTGAGRIVNISSLGGIRPWEMYAHYCASKAGVIMLTRALAKAFAPEITVNSVAPGVILASSEDPRAQDLIAATPAQRSGTPEEIADAVLYFINASNFVTGQVLAVDGGLSQR